MPDKTCSLAVTIQGAEQVTASLDLYVREFGADLNVLVAGTAEASLPADMALAYVPQLSAQLDMWISIGGAASQTFLLDTTVTTPLIVGGHVVSDSVASDTYQLVNLDPDVVALQIGPNAVGVVLLSSFVNNGDGTGSFTATFDTAVPFRQMSVVAVDDVDNESAESPLHIVNSLEQAKLNDTLSIVPQETISTPTCNRLIASVPDSNFTLKRQYTLPYSFDDTVFEIRTVTPNAPIEVAVVRRGLAGESGETQRYVVVPATEVQLLPIRLGRGTNVITAFDSYGRADTVIVAATTYAAVLCGYAREIYNNSRITIDEQEAAIFSPTSTRLAEPLLPFLDLLPDVRSQQTLAAKLAIRSLVADAGRQIGVRDLLTALTLSTPIFVQQLPDEQYFEPITRPMFNSQEAFGGVEAHVWLANACVSRWLAFVAYLSNADAFTLVSLTENEVVFRDDNGDVQRHVFDFTAEECSLTTLALQALCFDTIDIGITVVSESDIPMCAATYPFDMRPGPSAPIHPIAGEYGTELALDPGFDGYTDVSVTGHWDGRVPLDSRSGVPAVSSGLPTCVFEDGYLIRPLLLASATTPTVSAGPSIAIVTDVETGKNVYLNAYISAAGVEATVAMDMNIRDVAPTPTRSAELAVAVEATESLTLGLTVLVSA